MNFITDKGYDYLSSYSWDVPDNKSGSGFTTSVTSSEHVLASGCFSPTTIRDDPASGPGTSGLQSQTTAIPPPASKQMTSLLPPPPFSTPSKLKPVEEVMSNITGTDVASLRNLRNLRNLATSLARESIFGKDELAKKEFEWEEKHSCMYLICTCMGLVHGHAWDRSMFMHGIIGRLRDL